MTLSSRAEFSRDEAHRALAHYRDQQVLAVGPGRRGNRGAGVLAASSSTYNARDAMLRLIAIAEDFSFARLVEVGESRLPEGEFARLLWEAELDRSADTWDQRNSLWRKYLGVSFGTFPHH